MWTPLFISAAKLSKLSGPVCTTVRCNQVHASLAVLCGMCIRAVCIFTGILYYDDITHSLCIMIMKSLKLLSVTIEHIFICSNVHGIVYMYVCDVMYVDSMGLWQALLNDLTSNLAITTTSTLVYIQQQGT